MKLPAKQSQWYEEWFNSPYYHILYQHRDYLEAELFIDHLLSLLRPKENAKFLDLGCGKGRHAVYLNKKGFNVTALDLSSKSIAYATPFENSKLEFYIHDMRKPFRINYFDLVLNLFTSFGYFENDRDDEATINNISKALKPGGIFVLDFMNTKKVIANIVQSETIIIDGVHFHICKSIENNFIVKRISFIDKRQDYALRPEEVMKEKNFQERVKMLTLSDLKKYFSLNNLEIIYQLGNYKMEDFCEDSSDRLIIIAKKMPHKKL